MVIERERLIIELDPASEVAKVLATAGNRSVVLISNGHRYAVHADEADLWADYDPQRVRDALRAAAGTLTAEEGERLKELVYRGREEGTRPIDPP